MTMKIDDVLKKLDIQRHNFVLLSDAARYMTACTAALKLLHPQLFHITCMAHLLHNCAEKVRTHFQQVDNLNCKSQGSDREEQELATSSTRSVDHRSQCSLAGVLAKKPCESARELSMHFKVTIFWLATLKLLLMIPTLLNYLPRFTATIKCFPK